jgi:hypothetical protein
LNLTAHVALGVGLTRKERRVLIPPVFNVLLTRHVRTDEYIYLEHLNLLFGFHNPWRSVVGIRRKAFIQAATKQPDGPNRLDFLW